MGRIDIKRLTTLLSTQNGSKAEALELDALFSIRFSFQKSSPSLAEAFPFDQQLNCLLNWKSLLRLMDCLKGFQIHLPFHSPVLIEASIWASPASKEAALFSFPYGLSFANWYGDLHCMYPNRKNRRELEGQLLDPDPSPRLSSHPFLVSSINNGSEYPSDPFIRISGIGV